MERVLITGASGFVGRHLVSELKEQNPDTQIFGLARNTPNLEIEGATFYQTDLCDSQRLKKTILEIEPTRIVHLAAESNVAESWRNPQKVLKNNITGFLNLLEAARKLPSTCRLLVTGSSEQYGTAQRTPISEKHELAPLNPYAISKCAQEHMGKLYARDMGLQVILTRSFNHIGPGQCGKYAVSSFAKQMIEYASDNKNKKIKVGNIKVIRDFVDVRDVVKAYVKLLESGRNGVVYNVCQGKGHTVESLIELMMEISGIDSSREIDATLLRPQDVPVVVGSRAKITRELGWEPKLTLHESLRDILADWKTRMLEPQNEDKLSEKTNPL